MGSSAWSIRTASSARFRLFGEAGAQRFGGEHLPSDPERRGSRTVAGRAKILPAIMSVERAFPKAGRDPGGL